MLKAPSGLIQISSNDINLRKWVIEFFKSIKRELEKLYKEFLPLLPVDLQAPDSDKYFHIEKKLNDVKSKTQEYLEYIQDMKV